MIYRGARLSDTIARALSALYAQGLDDARVCYLIRAAGVDMSREEVALARRRWRAGAWNHVRDVTQPLPDGYGWGPKPSDGE